jgi:zinc D-Ala-D-Ala carboxypeptidase
MKISDHFYLEEITNSQTASRMGIPNDPPKDILDTAIRVATRMEKVRSALGDNSILVSSWYRSPKLNIAIGGVGSSQHCKGEAVDFTCPDYGDCATIAKRLVAVKDLLRFDQLILEHTWVHISFSYSPEKPPRGQVLSLLKTGAYATGLTDNLGVPYV